MTLALRMLNKGLDMTDNRESNEFGFDESDVESLKKVTSETHLTLELDVESQGRESADMRDEYLEAMGESAEQSINLDGETVKHGKKSGNGLILGLSGLVVALIVGAGGYFFVAPMVLGGGQQAASSFSSAPVEEEQAGGSLAFSQQGQETGSAGLVSASDGSNAFDGLDIDETDLFAGDNHIAGNGAELVAFSGNNDAQVEPEIAQEEAVKDDVYANMPDEGDVVVRPQISDEERMYDNILAEASIIDAPHEAIKIDRNVVTMELQVKRMNRVEMDIAETRESLQGVKEVIGAIREQTSAIAKTLEDNNVNNKRLSDDIKQLSVKVESQIESQKADIAALQIDLKKVEERKVSQISPAAQVAVQEKPAIKPVSVSKPAVEQEKVVAATVQKAVNLPAPAARPVTVKAPVVKAPAVRTECASTKVSENWRVKGVTPSSAYVERVQDGQGLLLKAGVSLPGFGTVKSFNPVERSVCTTNGLVRR